MKKNGRKKPHKTNQERKIPKELFDVPDHILMDPEMTTIYNLGERIKYLRKQHRNEDGYRWSQTDLANKVSAKLGYDITYRAVGEWESGGAFPTVEKLLACSEALGCTVDFLIGRSDDPKLSENEWIVEREKQANSERQVYLQQRRDALKQFMLDYDLIRINPFSFPDESIKEGEGYLLHGWISGEELDVLCDHLIASIASVAETLAAWKRIKD